MLWPAAQVGHRTEDQRQWGTQLVADIGEERGLDPVEFSELFCPLLLGLIAACATDFGGDLAGDQIHEPAVTLVQRPVTVQGSHEESARRVALQQQGQAQRARGRIRPLPRRQAGERVWIELEE